MNLATQNIDNVDDVDVDDSVGGFKGICSCDENEDVDDDLGDFK